MQHEPVVLAERLPVARRAQHRPAAELELETAVEGDALAGAALGDHASALVEEHERAAEMAADDREQGLYTAPLQHGVGKPLGSFERASAARAARWRGEFRRPS